MSSKGSRWIPGTARDRILPRPIKLRAEAHPEARRLGEVGVRRHLDALVPRERGQQRVPQGLIACASGSAVPCGPFQRQPMFTDETPPQDSLDLVARPFLLLQGRRHLASPCRVAVPCVMLICCGRRASWKAKGGHESRPWPGTHDKRLPLEETIA